MPPPAASICSHNCTADHLPQILCSNSCDAGWLLFAGWRAEAKLSLLYFDYIFIQRNSCIREKKCNDLTLQIHNSQITKSR